MRKLIIPIILLLSCNPVKKVLNNKAYYNEVKEAFILNNECANDTTIINTSDTTVLFDTLYTIESDTVEVPDIKEVIKTKVVTKTITIRDTIKSVVVDRTKENLLNNQILLLKNENADLRIANSKLQKDLSGMKSERNKWRLYFFLLVGSILVYLFRKPILKLTTRIFSPIKF